MEAICGDGHAVVWPVGEPFMVVGSPGVGKSTVTEQLMLARSAVWAPTWLGYTVRPTKPGRTALYLAMDRPPQIARSLRRMVTEDQRGLLNERLEVWRGPLPPEVRIERDPRSLLVWIEETFPRSEDVYADSLKDMGCKLSSDEGGTALNTAIQIVVQSGRQWVSVHHDRKAEAGTKTKRAAQLDDVYGSVWLTAGHGSVMLLWGDPGDTAVELRHLKPPDEPVGPLSITHDHTTGRSTVITDTEGSIISALVAAGQGGATVAQIALAALHSNNRAAQERVRRDLKKLEDEGAAKKVGEGGRGGTGGGAHGQLWAAV